MSLLTFAARLWVPPTRLADGLRSREDNFLLLRFVAAALVIYGHGYNALLAFPLATALGALSWRFVERPALRFKDRVPWQRTKHAVSADAGT